MWFDFTLLVILGFMFSINAAYAVIAPFVPIVFVQKGIAVSYIGLTISLHALSFAILGPFVGSWMVVENARFLSDPLCLSSPSCLTLCSSLSIIQLGSSGL